MKGVWKKALVLMLVAVLLVTIYPGFYKESGAQTNISMDDFEDIIGTYNIDDSILSYKDYVNSTAPQSILPRLWKSGQKIMSAMKKTARQQPLKFTRIMRVWRVTAC